METIRQVIMQQGVMGAISIALVVALVYMYKQFVTALSTQTDKCKACQDKTLAATLLAQAEHNKAMSELRTKNEKDLGDLYEAMHDNAQQMCDTMERINVRGTDAITNLTTVVSKFSGMLERINGGR